MATPKDTQEEPQEAEEVKDAKQLSQEIIESKSFIGKPPTEDIINQIRHLWGIEGLQKQEICRLVGVGMNVVNAATKGIPPGKDPAAGVLKRLQEQKPEVLVSRQLVVTSPAAPSQEANSSLYALAVQKGFRTIDEFIFNELVPWYAVKMEWEFRAHKRISPEEFLVFLDEVTRKSIKFDELAQTALKEGMKVE